MLSIASTKGQLPSTWSSPPPFLHRPLPPRPPPPLTRARSLSLSLNRKEVRTEKEDLVVIDDGEASAWKIRAWKNRVGIWDAGEKVPSERGEREKTFRPRKLPSVLDVRREPVDPRQKSCDAPRRSTKNVTMRIKMPAVRIAQGEWNFLFSFSLFRFV